MIISFLEIQAQFISVNVQKDVTMMYQLFMEHISMTIHRLSVSLPYMQEYWMKMDDLSLSKLDGHIKVIKEAQT